MRKFFILAIALSINIVAFAQRALHTQAINTNSFNNSNYPFLENTYARTTGIGDTLALTNIPAADTLLVVYITGDDSGYITGTNTLGDRGFAERYDISGADSSLVVIGVIAQFYGKVNSTSSHTVMFNVWSASVPVPVSATYGYSSFPDNNLDSLVVPVTQLGIGVSVDTVKTFLFPNHTDTVQGSFFVGYTMNYNFATLAGDTIGLACSPQGERTSPLYDTTSHLDSMLNAAGTGDSVFTVYDTLVNVQNATQWSDYTWHDNYTDNFGLFNDLAIYPIVVIGAATEVKGVTKNNLTFFGNYPNPATDATNIKFSLLKNADVTIQLMDMSGRIINTINSPRLSVGEHVIPVNTTSLPAGDYIYIIHTSGGDGIAGKMTVIK